VKAPRQATWTPSPPSEDRLDDEERGNMGSWTDEDRDEYVYPDELNHPASRYTSDSV